MKVRARKFSASMTGNGQAPCSVKKRRKEPSFWQRKKDVAAALITSSARKRRIDTTTTSLCLVSSTRVRVVPGVDEAPVASEDPCRNLHLTFSSSMELPTTTTNLKEIDAAPEKSHAASWVEAPVPVSDARQELKDTEPLHGRKHEVVCEWREAEGEEQEGEQEGKDGVNEGEGVNEVEVAATEVVFGDGEDGVEVEEAGGEGKEGLERIGKGGEEVLHLGDSNVLVESTVDPITFSEQIVDQSILSEPNLSSRPSMLETIFSPVFQLFKGYGEDLSLSGRNSVEQAEPLEQRIESLDVGTPKWDTSDLSPDAQVILASCSTPITCSAEYVAACRFDTCGALSPGEEHVLHMKSPLENSMVTLVDSSGDCIDWDPLDDKAAGDADRRILDHVPDVLTSDDADLFLAVEQSKSLECNDEVSGEGDTAVDEEFEDIDPYLFIKRLPSLEEVVSPCRPLLLPRQTRRSPPITLVLDLDETLVHSTLELCEDADFSFPVHFDFQEHMVYVRRRPHLQEFMERVAQLFEIIVFTASQSVYAEQLLNVLDPKRKLIRHRIFRDSCVFVRGNYLKDLTILGRDLSKVAIIDNSPQAYGFQVDNGIPIESWFEDRSDGALAGLLPFLETLVGVDDVRPIIAKRFNLRGKIAAAAELPYLTNRGDPLERFS